MPSQREAARKAAAVARAKKSMQESERTEKKRKSRRRFLIGAGALAGGGIAGLSGYQILQSMGRSGPTDVLVPGSYGFTYTAGEQQKGAWFAKMAGQPVRAGDFASGQGALAMWDGVGVLKPCSILYLDPTVPHVLPVEGGGTKTDTGIDLPDEVQVVRRDKGLFIAFYAGCTHACCVLGYHEAYPGLDIYHCTCHNARFDPWKVVQGTDEHGNKIIGALNTQLPATRPLPYIPLELVGDRLHGILTEENREWYRYCGVKKDGR